MIRDIYSNRFGKLGELTVGGSKQDKEKINALNNATTYMFNWVTSFCPLLGQGMLPDQIKSRQLVLSEMNIVRVLLDLLAFFSLTNNPKMIAMCIRCFKNICDGNPTT